MSSLISGSIDGEVQPHGEFPFFELLADLKMQIESVLRKTCHYLKMSHLSGFLSDESGVSCGINAGLFTGVV